MTKRRSVWIEDEDEDGEYFPDASGLVGYAFDHPHDGRTEFREVLPDDGWQPWDVAKEWDSKDHVIVWGAGIHFPTLSDVGAVRHWRTADNYLYLRLCPPDSELTNDQY